MALTSSTLTSFTSFFCLCVFCVNAVTYKEILQTGQSLGTSDSVVSDSGKFELCFFNRVRDNSTKYYVGIRYKRVPNDKNKIVWVANRDYALETSSAVLTFQPDGNFVIMDGQVTYRVNKVSNNFSIYAMLLDSGNLILLKTSNKQILWQSFDHPTDTLLPGMKLGHDKGNTWSLRSWTSADDPAPGAFSLEYNLGRVSLIINNGSNAFWIDDHYNDTIGNFIRRSGVSMDSYFTLPVGNDSRLVLEVSGELNQEYWSDEQRHWVSIQSSKCANNSCGAFSICNPKARDPCDCLYGFRPSDADSWNNGNKSAGCVRNKDLSSCSNAAESNDKFKQLYNVKSPTLDSLRKINTTKECESTCSRNCSCLAFAYYLNGDCQLWLGSVLNLKNVSTDVDNSDNSNPIFYLRLAASELDDSGEDLLHFDISMSMKVEDSELTESDRSAKVKKEVKLPLFSFESVAAATNNFSDANKLGEGGFGPGTLFNGDEVAVKRLSRRSGQGWEELRNEALLIAKLQHNNLVRLLGCCIDRNEKMLIYEFMPNKSLDLFLFDATKKQMLDWGTRVRIIDGIAQGILYLHQYSRFRIIHRDLKASNILLDSHMNPKISDFGLAKIFGDNELQANTNRIKRFIKDSIFNLTPQDNDDFIWYDFLYGVHLKFSSCDEAWDLWTRNSGLDLMDSALDDSDTLGNNSMHTVPRYVNIGLLCVQESPEDRPTMSDVVSMIGNDTVPLPSPKPPAFLKVRGDHSSSLPSTSTERFSVDYPGRPPTKLIIQADHSGHQADHPGHPTDHPGRPFGSLDRPSRSTNYQTNHQADHPGRPTTRPIIQVDHPGHQADHPGHQADKCVVEGGRPGRSDQGQWREFGQLRAEQCGAGRSEVVGALMGLDEDITEGPPGGFQKDIEKTNRLDGRRQVQRVDSVSGSNTETFGAHRGAELVFPIDVNTTFRPQPLGLNHPALRPPLFGPSAPTIRPIGLNCSAHRPQPSGPLASIARPFGLNHLALQAIVNLQIKNPDRPFRRSATVDLQQNIPVGLSEGRRPWIFNKISRPAFPKVGDRGSSTKYPGRPF
ncbi:hypothetical protein V8G54_024187 [Vigna mungo]|uniref:Non-specific serine/threonine protein kinase n=1 Tax=Vigna mungo TaxID=3915 RepID=A0AAQ3N6U1_VIGMU